MVQLCLNSITGQQVHCSYLQVIIIVKQFSNDFYIAKLAIKFHVNKTILMDKSFIFNVAFSWILM